MSAVLIVVIVAVVVLIAVGIALAASQRSTRLRRHFGTEYERTVRDRGDDRAAAEKELSGRLNRHKQFHLVALPAPAQQQYAARWQQIQTAFVDAPGESVRQADVLVSQVMTDRGYPVAEFDQRAADVSVDHPDLVDTYRSAHDIALHAPQAGGETEDLRQAMVKYRALFQKLLEPVGDNANRAAVADQQQPPPPPPVSAGAPGAQNPNTPVRGER
ncbi:MAG: hypothetical protein JOY68_05670 [Candidatus Dormibacteraeota bacterium]|nr:hypothetical protein [Candidatus Dormibacteraeota bacterium]MBV8445525.1 hypothetical protein [Candidatus Dormibacteraeota bacterium]